jgi:predicted Zn-dependent protease
MNASVFSIGCLLSAAPLLAGQNPRLEYALGVLAENRGEAGMAADHFENARLLDPTAAPLVKRAVSRMIGSGNRAGAIALFREFASSRPDDLGTQLSYADFLIEHGKGDSLALKLARETLDAALAGNPGHPEIIRRLVSINPERGKDLLDSLSSEDPASTLLFAALFQSVHEADDTSARAELERRLTESLAVHPADAALARAASEHFRNTGKMDKAIDALKLHTSAAPWSLDLRVRSGILCFAAKRDAEGEAILKELLVIHPRHALAHQSLAKFHRLRDEPAPAAFHSGELLKIRGGSGREFLELAEAHLAAGRVRDARLLLEKAVFEHPDDVALRMKLAIATHQDPESRARAPRLFREAESAAGDAPIKDPVFLSTSAEALIESGQIKAGEERLRAAIRSHPPEAKKETAASLRRLAALWTSENRNAAEARALLKRADALDPE